MLILVGLQICDKRSIIAEDRQAIADQMGWFEHGLHQVIELARGPIRESHPEIANAILDCYLPVFLKVAGTSFGSMNEADSTRAWKSMKEGKRSEASGVMTQSDSGEINILVDRTSAP